MIKNAAKVTGLWFTTLFAILILVGWPLALHALDQQPLAVPAATAADWVKNPQGSFAAVLADNERLSKIVAEYQGMLSTASWVAGGIGTLLAIARFVPGVQQPFANMLYGIWASKQSKAAEEKQEVFAQGFKEVADIMRAFPKDSPLGDVLDKLSRDLPDEVKQAYREMEKAHFDLRPAPSTPAA